MEAPKCKLCGSRHYGLCAAPKAAEGIGAKPATRAASGPVTTPKEITPKFDRNAYQRDYMRKRRAAQKAAKP